MFGDMISILCFCEGHSTDPSMSMKAEIDVSVHFKSFSRGFAGPCCLFSQSAQCSVVSPPCEGGDTCLPQ